MKQVIVIGVNEDFSQFYFTSNEDFSFTPWVYEITDDMQDCIYSSCLAYIKNSIFYSQIETDIDNLYYICSKNDYENEIYTDIFVYVSDEFHTKISCDFLQYNENTLDFDFNLINSWIIPYIYNKFANQNTVYIF